MPGSLIQPVILSPRPANNLFSYGARGYPTGASWAYPSTCSGVLIARQLKVWHSMSSSSRVVSANAWCSLDSYTGVYTYAHTHTWALTPSSAYIQGSLRGDAYAYTTTTCTHGYSMDTRTRTYQTRCRNRQNRYTHTNQDVQDGASNEYTQAM